MKSVLLPFYTNMELEAYPEKDKRDILRIIAEYLLGCSKFKDAKSSLAEYECQKSFQTVLRSLTPPYQKIYRRSIRKYLLGRDVKLHEFDAHHLARLNRNKLLIKVLKYPDENNVVKTMTATINTKIFHLGTNRQLRRMTQCGADDVKQLVFMKMLQTYRTYLPSVGVLCPLKAFYRILHRAVDSSILDKIRQFKTTKAQMTVPFTILGEDFESGIDANYFNSGHYYGSPEDDLQAKETLCLDIPHDKAVSYLEVYA